MSIHLFLVLVASASILIIILSIEEYDFRFVMILCLSVFICWLSEICSNMNDDIEYHRTKVEEIIENKIERVNKLNKQIKGEK